MFNGVTRESFKVDCLMPAAQTVAIFATTEVLGRLGLYVINNKTAVLVGGVASIVASFANNFFKHDVFYFTFIPVGIGAGVQAHRFFYPHIFKNVLDVKGLVLIVAVTVIVKLIVDHQKRLWLVHQRN